MTAELQPHDELTLLAHRYRSDKGSSYSFAHGYTRIYQAMLEPVRHAPLRIAEIGLVLDHVQTAEPAAVANKECSSLHMWAEYLPAARLFGFDRVDFRHFASERIMIAQGDQGERADLRRFAENAGGRFDLIIDDGSHASHHQQIALATLFPYLADGGLYVIEDLHYQPPHLEIAGIATTRQFLFSLVTRQTGLRLALQQSEFGYLLDNIEHLHFFDSLSPHYPRHVTADALAVLKKRGHHAYFNFAF